MKLQILLAIATFVTIEYCEVSGSTSPISFILKIGMTVLKSNKYFGKDKTFSIEKSFLDVSSKIDSVEKTMKSSAQSTIREINRLIQYNQIMNQFEKNLNFIDKLYDQFRKYFTHLSYERTTLKDFAKSSTSHANNQLRSVLDSIHRAIVPNSLGTTGLFDSLIESRYTKEDAALLCNRTASLRQEIFELYNIADLAQVKGYTVMRFSYEILKELADGNYTTEINDLQQEFVEVVSSIGTRASLVMNIASNDIRLCDPGVHIEGETYEQLMKFIQGFVVNEVSLNRDHTCRKSCKDYKKTIFYPYSPSLSEGIYTCKGELYNCFNERGWRMCPPNNNGNGDRRYGGFTGVTVLLAKDEPSKGDISNCPADSRLLNEIFYSSSGYLTSCSICQCLCDDYKDTRTVRAFSLRKVESKISENMIVTGMRLKKEDKMFYIQIQQGKLESDGKILNTSLQWMPVDTFNYSKPKVSQYDYHVMNYNQRSLNLDTLVAPAGNVLTGAKFSVVDGRLVFKIRATPFNFTNGTLGNEFQSRWFSNDEKHTSQIIISNPHIPTLAVDENIVDVSENSFLEFGWSDYRKDISQTPVPFLDIQPVVTDPSAPLSGAGIYYKGLPGYGGFVALKLIAYNYAEFVTTDLSLASYNE